MPNAFDILNKKEHGAVEVQYSGTQFCRTYSDGWLEQGNGGYTNLTQDITIKFIKQFKDTNYTLCGVGYVIAGAGRQNVTKYTDGFATWSEAATSNTYGWYACGYGAEE